MNQLKENLFKDLSCKGLQNSELLEILNNHINEKLERFWEKVVIPLEQEGLFNPNKLRWYFEVYKEGIEANRVINNIFPFINISDNVVNDIISFYNHKTIEEYMELGSTYLSNTFMVLSAWYRNQMIMKRLKYIYKSEKPVEWIKEAEKEEWGKMTETVTLSPELYKIMENIKILCGTNI